mmetsp:Transcript_266/g.865  ORF Transcript_266/g.865 Transcript_266/m.865 type:complete len:85 (-) Transcript_266:1811-2065(-)
MMVGMWDCGIVSLSGPRAAPRSTSIWHVHLMMSRVWNLQGCKTIRLQGRTMINLGQARKDIVYEGRAMMVKEWDRGAAEGLTVV